MALMSPVGLSIASKAACAPESCSSDTRAEPSLFSARTFR